MRNYIFIKLEYSVLFTDRVSVVRATGQRSGSNCDYLALDHWLFLILHSDTALLCSALCLHEAIASSWLFTVELRVTMSRVIQVIVVLLSILSFSRSQVIEGLLALDKLSFDKIINRFEYSLVKFDVGFPTGEKHNNFGQLAKEVE